MAISEESRHRLYGRLEELLGREEAATLMEHLPPVGWADVATKRDLDHLAEAIRGELAVTEARLEAGFQTGLASLEARLETGLASLETRFQTGLASLEARLETGLASQEARLETGLARASLDTRAGLRTLFLGLVGLQMSGAALVLAVARAT